MKIEGLLIETLIISTMLSHPLMGNGDVKMNLKIGTVIYQLRKKHDVTQEQLANVIGVSVPAISKWENGISYPDITLLPIIARYFNTTIDELMSYEMTISEEEIKAFIEECQMMLQTESFNKIVKLCEDYLRQYPNSLELKLNIGSLYMMSFSFLTEESEIMNMMKKAIDLFEKAATSSNLKIQEHANYLLASLYGMTEDEKKAEEVLLKLPKTELNRDDLLIPIYIRQERYEEAKKMVQLNMMKALQSITLYLSNFTNIAMKENNLELAEKLLAIQPQLVTLFELEKELGYGYALEAANFYARLKNKEKALINLELLVNKLSTTRNRQKSEFFDLLDLHEGLASSQLPALLLRTLEIDPTYDFLKNEEQFKQLVHRVEQLT